MGPTLKYQPTAAKNNLKRWRSEASETRVRLSPAASLPTPSPPLSAGAGMTQSMSSRGGGGSGRGYGIHHHQHHSALCCLSAAPPMPGDATPTMPLTPDPAAAAAAASGAAVAVEGVLQKWTNYGRGWRERWFTLHDGVLSYSKIRDDAGAAAAVEDGEVRLIGSRIGGSRRREKPAGVVSLKVRAQPLPFSCDPASRWGRFCFSIPSSLFSPIFSPHLSLLVR